MKVHRIPVGPFATNCVLIEDEASREALVVDPGGDLEVIEERLAALHLKPTLVVHTHGHMDHVMASSAFATRHGVTIAMHEADLPLYRNLRLQVQALLGPRAAADLGAEPLVEPTRLLKAGDKVRVGALEAEVLHLPGHSPGSIGLLFAGNPATLVAGDTLFRDGVGRTDLWGGDWDTLLRSIREGIFTLPAPTIVVSGHGPDTTVGREKDAFPYR